MKTSEASLWRWLSKARRIGYHLERVENLLFKSMPDVEASTGAGGFWIELKTAARPKRETTPVRFKFQNGQANWLQRRWNVDRCAWLLVQVDRRRYLVAGSYAFAVEDGLTEADIAAISVVPTTVKPEEVLEAISLRVWGDIFAT